MELRHLTSAEDFATYNGWVKGHPQGTLWQSLEWKMFQEALGRRVKVYAGFEGGRIAASALVVIDRTAFGLSTWDIPRGPLGDGTSESMILEHVEQEARQSKCMTLFLSAMTPLPLGQRGWGRGGRHEQPEATRVVDLTLPEDQLLAQMKPKGRYNISVARKNGVRVERSEDIGAFYGLLKQTGGRDRFGILPQRHYETFLRTVHGSFLLLASLPPTTYHLQPSPQQPIAGLIGTLWNKRGIYYYGASDYAYRPAMAPYLLQWEAMQRCKAKGCTSYDLLGIAPPGADSRHPWAGISGFKEKFGGTVVTYPEEQQIVLRPLAQRLLKVKRRLVG